MADAAPLLARYLEQRRELGADSLILPPELMQALASIEAPAEAAVPEPKMSASSSPAAPAPPREAPAPRPPARPRAEPSTGPVVQIGSFDQLEATACSCTACRLSETRTQVVFEDGNRSARLVVVGEAPGADEDRIGKPFVGKAGRLLNALLLSVGFPRESVYICNVLKCRPPRNRNPTPEEVSTCRPYLQKQLEFVAPQAILAVGTFPAQTLLETDRSIGRLRGSMYEYQGIPLIPTYHPAALLRNPAWVRPVWEDLQRLRSVIDG